MAYTDDSWERIRERSLASQVNSVRHGFLTVFEDRILSSRFVTSLTLGALWLARFFVRLLVHGEKEVRYIRIERSKGCFSVRILQAVLSKVAI